MDRAHGAAAFVAINLANVGRAVPSYAVMAMILPVSLSISPEFGLAVIPTFLAMTLLAIPPILVNTYAALRGVDRDLIEAARGMGMREGEILAQGRDPDRPPGHRRWHPDGGRAGGRHGDARRRCSGYGGLGRYLIDGIARSDYDRLFAGVVLVAGLAC